MNFRFVWVGKTRDKNWKALEDEYYGRLSHFIKSEVIEIKEVRGTGAVELEGKRILEKLNQKSFVVALDVSGRSIGSEKLASEIEQWQIRGLKEISFVIGGPAGLSTEIDEKADFSLSLSFLTFTHEMARVVLLEQLYRAFTIIKM
ncbi:MAG: 23S rRNA (pseudouridine(1915)-N(3))-methyltransferase RlmH [Acidobacteria bacterium]|nr:23S rRNA (pseudouridine(1915)-N(3))-methyltransferase RlmH [Acidobacteriota bacterium]